jgi:hypothetical protein
VSSIKRVLAGVAGHLADHKVAAIAVGSVLLVSIVVAGLLAGPLHGRSSSATASATASASASAASSPSAEIFPSAEATLTASLGPTLLPAGMAYSDLDGVVASVAKFAVTVG